MKITGFANVQLVLEDKVIRGDIHFEDGVIHLGKASGCSSLPSTYYVVPGFIDEHIHGAGGCDVMDGEESSLSVIANSLPQEGVTSFLATTMTESIPSIQKALTAVKNHPNTKGSRILGVHLEGPFISSTFKGAQAEEHIRKPNAELLRSLDECSGNRIRLVTFAYEEEGGEEFLQECLTRGITPSLGHSDASGTKALEGFSKGISCVTHLYNAQRRFHHRDIGVTGASLLDKNVYTELIADFHHSSKEAVKFALQCKPNDKMILISDSTEAKYLPLGTSAALGSQPIHVEDGVAKLEDGTIAGSVLRLDKALQNIRSLFPEMPLHELIAMVSINPAKNIRVDDKYGSIREGKVADLVVLDENLNVVMTFIGGELAFTKESL
ncbi:MAG: N-acetylglucosamine-6-phosphate deacetylase [Candidatus Enteromonas sp.]|nr:N-acetylglucosamine-6-phosphate deacetylase [Candidatus Enteromonas sp.]